MWTTGDDKKKVIMRYRVNPDGTLSNGKVFFDMTSAPGEDALDGMKVDERRDLYVSRPVGLWIIPPRASIWERSVVPTPHNMAWGHEDRRTLYLCAQTGFIRIRLNVTGIRQLAQKELAKR